MAAQANQQGQTGSQHQAHGQANAPGKKPRRPAGSIYALAARQRKIQQQYTNLHHRPNMEDIWICEFCEYESIFGHPPEALIRQYEIKDRKERRRLAEKRRLLEKAKMKGRKGKKATKNAAKNAATQPPQSHHQGYDHHPTDQRSMGAHGGHDNDDLGDDYDDEPIPMPPPPQQAPFKQSAPGGHHPKAAAGASDKGVVGGGTNRAA
jgi:hypothetical protein